MKTNILFASIASLIAFAPVAATAAPLAAKPVAEATPAAPAAVAATSKAKAPTRYCFEVAAPTGTRIPSTQCRTEEEWNRMNVKVPARFIR